MCTVGVYPLFPRWREEMESERHHSSRSVCRCAAGWEGEGGRCHCPEEEGGLGGGGQGQWDQQAVGDPPVSYVCMRWGTASPWPACQSIVHTVIFILCCSVAGSVGNVTVASFPGRSRRQYFIAFQFEIRRGKAWEIWSRAVPSSRSW